MTIRNYFAHNYFERLRWEQWLEMYEAVKSGNEQRAGLCAARVVTITNALVRVDGNESELINDPLFGRYNNNYEYFQTHVPPGSNNED